jgi:hypothetical protein
MFAHARRKREQTRTQAATLSKLRAADAIRSPDLAIRRIARGLSARHVAWLIPRHHDSDGSHYNPSGNCDRYGYRLAWAWSLVLKNFVHYRRTRFAHCIPIAYFATRFRQARNFASV